MKNPQLRDLVLAQAILRGTEARPIFRVDGTQSRWMLNTLDLSLTAAGAQLSARALLQKLASFEGRQLATYGTTGIPLMQAVIAESKGRYTGLLVRKEVKAHGARLRVQGPRGEGPVVIVDDSVSSGHSIRECRNYLEEHGYDVEGGVVLVRFGYDGVASLLEEDALRVEAVFDVERDLRPQMPGEDDLPIANPGKYFPPWQWGRTKAKEGLHPAVLARQAIAQFLDDGTVPRPPRTLDRKVDGRGGVFVSLRFKADIHERPARAGFWHFPEEARGTGPEDLLKACVLTAASLAEKEQRPKAVLDACAIAVTFFSPLQPCEVGDLDNGRYGIVVRSTERVGVMGGALPNMPGIRDGWGQFRHAAFKNGRLYAHEPYELLRHDLTKCVEPGEGWQPTGVPKAKPTGSTEAFASLAYAWLQFHRGLGPRPRPSALSLAGFAQVFVSPHLNGALVGCTGDAVDAATNVDALFDRLAEASLRDERFEARKEGALTVVVSLLTLDLLLGEHEATTVMTPTRFGDQVLEVRQRERAGILLPYVVVTHDLDAQEYADAVVAKASIPHGPLTWTRYNCLSWVADAAGVRRLVDGLPARTGDDGDPRALGRLWADFLAAHSTAKGEAVNRYLPFSDEQLTGVAEERLAHSAWVKAGAGLNAQAAADLKRVPLEGATWPTLAFAALALQALGRKKELAHVTAGLRKFGPVRGEGRGEWEDYAAGQVLYALARTAPDAEVDATLAHYRRRFRARPAWGSVAWLTMAFAAWSKVKRDPALLDFAWEVAAWALRAQSADGGFWNDHQPDAPGALTAAYLEGFAVLLGELKRAGRTGPAKRLEGALARGFRFLARLTYLPGDAGLLPNPAFAVGGVRMSLTSGEVRLDFVQHALNAVLLHP